MGVVVEFRSTEGARVERYRANLAGVCLNRQNGAQGVVGGVCFHDDWSIGDPVGEDGGRDEGRLQHIEGFPSVVREIPRNTLPSKAGKRDHYVGVVWNEATVEIGESQE